MELQPTTVCAQHRPMKKLFLVLLPAIAGAAQISTTPPADAAKWRTVQLTPHFWAEGATVADVNHDGQTDVLSGPFWYAGPDFKIVHSIYQADNSFTNSGGEKIPGFEGALGTKNTYSETFITAARDLNGDGWTDYLVVGFPGKESLWWENPAGRDGLWKSHVILKDTSNESPAFIDITGDGQPELICMSGGTIGYATLDPKHPNNEWQWHAVSAENKDAYQRFTHGIGAGDINGDGRIDILEQNGWWEQPADLATGTPWKRHDVAFGPGGAQMYGYDVNADGRTDVVTSLEAHGYGLAWFEQTAEGIWNRHLLTDNLDQKGETGITFTQPHAIELTDINGDGLKDIVTGKRFWAHGSNGDAEPDATPVIYWFELKREAGKAAFVPHLIDDNSGIGTQLAVADLNQDGKPDTVVANKRGVFVSYQP